MPRFSKKTIIVAVVSLILTVFVLPRVTRVVWNFILGIGVETVKYFPFSEDDALKEWEEKIFKGRVVYSIDKENHSSFVLASSNGTASAMYYKIKLNITSHPIISWRWNAKQFPIKNKKENLKDAKQDDFVARVYVIFPSLIFTNTKALEYIWTESIPEGTIESSPYSKNLKLFVVESGKREEGTWINERRDIYEDYIAAFGEEPKSNIGAIAFMTDADSTGTNAEGFFDDIKIGYKDKEGDEK